MVDKDLEIGRVFEYNGEWYKVESRSTKCIGCFVFEDDFCVSYEDREEFEKRFGRMDNDCDVLCTLGKIPECLAEKRKDKKSVAFVQISIPSITKF